MLLCPFDPQFFQNDGTVASGCKLYTYATGTTTPQTSYQTQAGTAHTNPITLDTAGRIQPALWLSPGVEYRLRLETAAGVLIDEWDDIYGVGDGSSLASLADLADTSDAAKGDALVGVKRTDTGAVATTQHALNERTILNVMDFGAVGDGSTNDATAIQAAVDAANAMGGGTVEFPDGYNFKYTTAIAMKQGVNVVGRGYGSVLTPTGCSAFTFGFLTSFNNSVIDNLRIEASSGSAQIGIYQAGTLNDADELYGITITNCLIRGFNVAIKFRTVRNVTIWNNWIQDCNSAIHLIGQCLVVNIFGNKMVFATGSGSGTQYAIYTDAFNYTSGSGSVRPETVCIQRNIVYGYTNGIAFTGVVFGTVRDNDIQATGIGVSFSTASAPITIDSNYIQIAGASATIAINGAAQASALDSGIVIINNHINAVSTTAGTSIGVKLGDSGNGNQDNIRVENNSFFGFTLYDIAFYKSGHITVRGNSCYSTGVTNSIFCTALAANRLSYISENDCYSTIAADSGDIASGLVQIGKNIISQTTTDYGNAGLSPWITPSFSAGDYTGTGLMTWTVASGDVEVMRYRIQGKTMTVNIILTTTTVGGTVNSPLKIKIPAGKSVSVRAINPCHILDNGTRATAYLEVNPTDATNIAVAKEDGSNWTLSTDNTYIRGQIEFEIT